MKQKMQVRLKNFFKPEEGEYGMSQGSYVVTDKGEFKCYNTGPIWFGANDKGQIIEVIGEWKQNKQTQKWYLACNYGQAANEPPSQAQPPAQQPQQGPQQPRQGDYKPKGVSQDVWEAKDLRMARMNALNRAVDLWIAEKTPFGDCSLLDMADLLVNYIYKGLSKGGGPNPGESKRMADEFEAGMDEGQNVPDY